MIKVLIERHVAEDLLEQYQVASKKLLQQAMQAPGFISGESLKNANAPCHRMILASYQEHCHWNQWYHSKERQEAMRELRLMMEQDEKITVLEHI